MTDLFTQGSIDEVLGDLPRVAAQRRVALWDLRHPKLAGVSRGPAALARLGAASERLRVQVERDYERNFG